MSQICDATVCNFDEADEALEECVNRTCARLGASVNSNHECIFNDMNDEVTCGAECAEGPNPGKPVQCWGRVNPNAAAVNVCSGLGRGTVVPKYDPDILDNWNWELGDPVPQFCECIPPAGVPIQAALKLTPIRIAYPLKAASVLRVTLSSSLVSKSSIGDNATSALMR